jgi:hypothetical protein
MKVAFLSLLALVSVALAVPPYNSQSAFGLSEQDVQDAQEGVSSAFDQAGDKVKQWVQDGRDFINRNGLTCESAFTGALLYEPNTERDNQTNSLPTPSSPPIDFA